MLDSEFLHLVNKYGAELPREAASECLRDACHCCWDLDDCPDKMAELSARIEDWSMRTFPDLGIDSRTKLEYVLTQCLAFEIGLIDRPDEHDVSYPGVGIIAEATTMPKYRPFKAPKHLTFEYTDVYSYTNPDGVELDFEYTIKPTVYFTDDDTEYDGFDDKSIYIDIAEDKQQYIPEIKEKLIDMINESPEIQDDICIAANEYVGEMNERYDDAYEQAMEAWQLDRDDR